MHLNDGVVPEEYRRHLGRKTALLLAGLAGLGLLFACAVALGSVRLPLGEVFAGLFGGAMTPRNEIILFNIRLPQALTALAAGAGLAGAGAAMQSILRNPLGSPFTLGISHAAAFGAAFAVMVMGTGVMQSSPTDAVSVTNPYATTLVSFVFCVLTAGIIVGVARMRRTTPEAMILTGVALGSLFTAGTMFLQYFADDAQLAAMVFWTFGDVSRADWSELAIIAAVSAASIAYFICNRWNYNAIDAGDETARGLGVRVERVRTMGMVVASLVTAVAVSFLGVIGFVGLASPHVTRRIMGGDHRFLLPGSCLVGALMLLGADTAARLIMAPQVLPVAILTAFLGAPLFLYLIIKGGCR